MCACIYNIIMKDKQTKQQLQKQVKELQMQINNLRKEIEACPPEKKLFEGLDESSTMDMITEAINQFTDYDAEFAIRSAGMYEEQGFYLGDTEASCRWEIVEDDQGAWVLKLIDTE